jgi:hypothetical protein
MNDLLVMLQMFSLFAVVIYAAHRLVGVLRAREGGARLDALHASTVRLQLRLLRLISVVLPRPVPGAHDPRPDPWLGHRENSTKKG